MGIELYRDGLNSRLVGGRLVPEVIGREALAEITGRFRGKSLPFRDRSGNVVGQIANLRVDGDSVVGDVFLDPPADTPLVVESGD